MELISRMPEIDVLRVKNEKFREQEYKQCIADLLPGELGKGTEDAV